MSHQECLICNSNQLSPLKGYSKDYLVKCKKCGFVFCQEIPSQEGLIRHYQSYNRDKDISPITVKRYNELLDQFESSRKNNKILDIGCGDGHFLTAALARGWEVHGTEFTDDAIEICKKKNINVQQGILDAKNYSSIQFDVITSFEVIEHINNPKTELENIKTILRSGGIFYLTTPNFNSISRFILKGKWNIITYPEHLSYYTAKTMNRFLSKNGFRKIKLQTTGISINRLQQSSSVLKSDSETNKDESLREKTESYILLQGIKKSINFFLNLFRMGDTIKGTYKKQ